jgi:Zn-dependent protease with chaperone function
MLLKIICSFILGTFISFVLAFVFDNEYLQGVAHLITSGGSAVVFWLTSIILLFISKHKTSTADRLGKVLLMSMVLVVPVLIYSLISNMSFKIGG